MIDLPPLRTGLTGSAEIVVGEEHTAQLVKVDGRTLDFRVEARDEREAIGDGLHQRVVVNVERFDARVQKKIASV
jgi:predicted thioesterase